MRFPRIVAGVAAVLLLGSACARDEPASPEQSATAPVADRGQLLSRGDPVTGDDGSTRTSVTYRSTSGIDGTATEVSGTIFVPAGPAPAEGRPVVTVGHGTTGVEDDCAPSDYPDLLGNLRLVTPLLERGYVVAVSDLQGLGTPGPHPYLEPKSAAYNLIDAVRAARNLVPEASNRWAALGLSQGGHASWAAAEHATDYGQDLDFVGSANLSPAADMSSVVGADGRATQLATAQQVFLPVLLAGLAVLHPDLNKSDYLRGVLAANEDVFLSCPDDYQSKRLAQAFSVRPDDSQPVSVEAAERMRGWLTSIALPQQRADGPMLVVTGELDPVIRASWTAAAVQRACALGDVIALHERPGERHGDSASIPEAVQWIADRFAGTPAPDTC